MRTVFDAFMATAEAAPGHAFLCAPPSRGRAYHPDGVEYTYAEVRAEVLAFRERYAAAGSGHGHRVGLLFENRPEFFFHYLALNAPGVGVVPINPDYRHFVDRKKNIIRRSGENIAAAEVEACLQAHAAVAQVAVLGAPDEIREEEVMACVVPMPGARGAARLAGELVDWCLGRLAYFKAPGWVLFVDRLPTTGTQKVQKAQIFPKGEDPRQRPGAIDLRARKKRG